MPTKTITDNVVGTLSKGPLVVFVMFAIGIWQASNMSAAQIDTLERLMSVLNNPAGAAVYLLSFFLLVYALLLFPVGKFVAVMAKEFVDSQKAHNGQTDEHVEASKGMFRQITILTDVCNHIKGQIDAFYGGKS